MVIGKLRILILWGIDMGNKVDKDVHILTAESQPRSLELVFYDEQLIRCFGSDDEVSEMNRLYDSYGSESDDYKNYVIQLGDKYYPNLKARIRCIGNTYKILGVRHDRDTYASSGFYKPSCAKRHFHIYIRRSNNSQFKVGFFVDKSSPKCLCVFDESRDVYLTHKLTTIADWVKACHYAWHDPALGKSTLNKHEYALSDLFANCDDVFDSCKGPIDVKEVYTPSVIGKTASDCCMAVRELGFLGRPIAPYMDELRCANATLAKGYEKTIFSSYESALYQFIESTPRTLPRLCIFLYDPNGNVGKSYNSKTACLNMGYSESQIVKASSSRYGGLDKLSADHKVLLLNDMSTEYAHQLSEQENNVIQRRGSGCVPNCLDIVIASSNANFKDWYSSVSYCNLSANYKSALTRWFVIDCSDKSDLKCTNYANRGDFNSAYVLQNRFDEWFEAFKSAVSAFKPAPKCLHAFKAKYPDLASWFFKQPRKCQEYFIERYENVTREHLLAFDPILAQSYEVGLYPLYVFLTCDKVYDEESEYESYIQSMIDEYESNLPLSASDMVDKEFIPASSHIPD